MVIGRVASMTKTWAARSPGGCPGGPAPRSPSTSIEKIVGRGQARIARPGRRRSGSGPSCSTTRTPGPAARRRPRARARRARAVGDLVERQLALGRRRRRPRGCSRPAGAPRTGRGPRDGLDVHPSPAPEIEEVGVVVAGRVVGPDVDEGPLPAPEQAVEEDVLRVPGVGDARDGSRSSLGGAARRRAGPRSRRPRSRARPARGRRSGPGWPAARGWPARASRRPGRRGGGSSGGASPAVVAVLVLRAERRRPRPDQAVGEVGGPLPVRLEREAVGDLLGLALARARSPRCPAISATPRAGSAISASYDWMSIPGRAARTGRSAGRGRRSPARRSPRSSARSCASRRRRRRGGRGASRSPGPGPRPAPRRIARGRRGPSGRARPTGSRPGSTSAANGPPSTNPSRGRPGAAPGSGRRPRIARSSRPDTSRRKERAWWTRLFRGLGSTSPSSTRSEPTTGRRRGPAVAELQGCRAPPDRIAPIVGRSGRTSSRRISRIGDRRSSRDAVDPASIATSSSTW